MYHVLYDGSIFYEKLNDWEAIKILKDILSVAWFTYKLSNLADSRCYKTL